MRSVGLRLLAGSVLVLLLLSGPACQIHQLPQEDKTGVPRLSTVVCAGFRPALLPSRIPELVRSPISGAVFAAEPVSQEIAERISELLFEKLGKDSRVNWVSPREAAAAFDRIASSKPTLTDKEIYMQAGKSLSAEAVLGGHVYRWREREGTDYSAYRPASVAFDLYLMSVGEGAIWWKARFDKTQVSLTEDLLDLKTFLKAKGRWMTADELAEIGLAEFAETFPGGEEE